MSNVDAVLSQKAREVPVGTLRHTVLNAARRFKSTWVELGKLLVQVNDGALYEQWGFESFEAYCLKELHIRKQTAQKLIRGFSFLNKHEPKAMEREDLAETAPAFEVVEVLAGADERGQLSAAEYKSVRDSIWSPQKPIAELRRELSDRFPRPVEPQGEGIQLRRLAGLARKLANELSASRKVPKAISERAAALAEDVEGLASEQAE